MLKEAIHELSRLANAAADGKTLHPEEEPAHVYYMQDGSGKWNLRYAEPAKKEHKILSLSSLADYIALARPGGSTDAITADVHALFYSHAKVTYFPDYATRRDEVTLPLLFSEPMLLLQRYMPAAGLFKQVDFLRLLRVSFADCQRYCPNLLDAVKVIRWEKSEEGGSAVAGGKRSLGTKIESKMSGQGVLPEEITLDVPVWNGFPWRAEVRCDLEVLPDTQSFALRPLPGKMEQAVKEAEQLLADELRVCLDSKGVACPLFYGVP